MTTIQMIDSPISEGVNARSLAQSVTTGSRPKRPGAYSATMTLGWRALLKLKHVPFQLFEVTLFPVMLTLMFTFIFGGALAGSITNYVQQLIPGILVLTVAMVSQYTALGLNTDIAKGIFDRFRALSFWRPAVLIGALLADTIRYSIGALVLILLGVLMGFRPEAGIGGVILSLAILLVFGFSLSWIWTSVGLRVDNAQSIMMISSVANFPLTFISNVFVDPATMPDPLQKFATINPVSLTVTAIRSAMQGTLTLAEIASVLIACAIIIAIFSPLTMYLYNHKNSK